MWGGMDGAVAGGREEGARDAGSNTGYNKAGLSNSL